MKPAQPIRAVTRSLILVPIAFVLSSALAQAGTIAPDHTFEADAENAQFGVGIAVGDFNGDGYRDILLGSDTYSVGGHNRGTAYLYLGSVSGFGATADWQMIGTQPERHLARALGNVGDVNGDGIDDFMIGEPTFSNDPADSTTAVVHLFYGSRTSISTTADWSYASHDYGDRFGRAIDTAGDVNGDGYSDIIIGAYFYDEDFVDEGNVLVFYGSPSGPAGQYDWEFVGGQADAGCGWGASTAGDVNGDGYDDVIFGAPEYDAGIGRAGRVWVFYGSVAGLGPVPGAILDSPDGGSLFGRTVRSAGDVDGDGFDDVIIGARRFDRDSRRLKEGAAFVYRGSASGLSTTPSWTTVGHEESGLYGHGVASAGDINADGFDDVMVGEPNPPSTGSAGRVYVFLGSATGLPTRPAWILEADQAGAEYGDWVEPAGDLDGDGHGDILIDAWRFDNDQLDEGRVFLYLGSTLMSHAMVPRSRAVDGDFSGDGRSDVLWRDPGTESLLLFTMNGDSLASIDKLVKPETAWPLAGVGDYNGDGSSDVLRRDPQSGRFEIDLMDGPVVEVRRVVETAFDANWAISATGDFDGNGTDDLLWRSCENGRAALLLLDGSTITYFGKVIGFHDDALEAFCVGTGDLDGDGIDDVLWRKPSGEMWVGLGAGQTLADGGMIVPTLATEWTVRGMADFNGDGRDDIVCQNETSHSVGVLIMAGSTILADGDVVPPDGTNWDLAGVGDFDGDGKPDLLWRDDAAGDLRVWRMNGLAVVDSVISYAQLPPEWRVVSPRANPLTFASMTEMCGILPVQKAASARRVAAPSAGLALSLRNPMRDAVEIEIEIPESDAVRLELFDVAGRRVRLLRDDRLSAGPHRFTWQGETDAGTLAAAGIYFVRLSTTAGTLTRKLVRVR